MLIVPLPGRRSSAAEHPKTLNPHIPNGTAMYGVQKFRIPGSRSQRTLGLGFHWASNFEEAVESCEAPRSCGDQNTQVRPLTSQA